MPRNSMSRLVVVVIVCAGFCSQPEAETPVPDWLHQARDIIETRAWLRAQAQRLQWYCWGSVRGPAMNGDPATVEMGEWPSKGDYADTMAVLDQAFEGKPVDWRTLAEGLRALDALTPQDTELEDLCLAVAGATMPESADRSRFSAIHRSLNILAKQRSLRSTAFLCDWTAQDKWAGVSCKFSFVTASMANDEEAFQDTRKRLYSLGFEAVGKYVEAAVASQILQERRAASPDNPSAVGEIDRCLAFVQERLEGKALHFAPGSDYTP